MFFLKKPSLVKLNEAHDFQKQVVIFYSCGLSTHRCLCVCVSVLVSWCLCVCLCVCVHDNLKNNGSIDVKLEQTVVYENSSEEFDIGHCPIKVKVTA